MQKVITLMIAGLTINGNIAVYSRMRYRQRA